MRTLSLTAVCFLLGLSVMTSGCSDPGSSEACIPVSLTVTYKGAPVEGAQVTFHSAGEGARTYQGRTDASGRAAIGTFSTDDGALARSRLRRGGSDTHSSGSGRGGTTTSGVARFVLQLSPQLAGAHGGAEAEA